MDTFLVEQAAGDAEGVLAADRYQRVDPPRRQRCLHPLDTAVDLVRVRPRRTDHGAPTRQCAPHPLDVEDLRVVLDDATPAVVEPDQLVAVVHLALADRRPE